MDTETILCYKESMKYSTKRSADGTQVQLVLEAQSNEEDEILRLIYHNGGIMALGETNRGRVELILGNMPPARP